MSRHTLPKSIYSQSLGLLGILIFSLILAVSCQGGGEEAPLEVSLALSGNPSTLDPHATTETLTFQVTKSLYDTLLEPDDDGELVPALARSWSVSDSQKEITFQLRRDVSFHDGSGFDARDAAASIERLRSPEFASPSAGEYSVIEEVQIVDDFTLRLILSEPNAPLLYTLASGWSAILPSEKIESGHNFAREPVGTGPFSLEQWVADERITLNKNSDYWMEDEIEVEKVSLQIIPEPSVQTQALMSGQVDILYIVSEEDVPVLQSRDDIIVETDTTSLVMVMSINTSRDILGEVEMRRALNHAIDKQTALDVAYGGGTPVGTFNDASNPFYADFTGMYPYDPAKAAELAREAGYSEDRVFDLVLPQNFAPHVTAGELYQEMLREAGIQARIRMVDWPTWISDVYGNANYDLTVIGHTGKLDPDGRFIGYGSGNMYVRYPNERLEELITEGRRTLEFSRRQEIYTQVQRIFAEQVPFVFVGSSLRRIAYSSDISGFRMTPNLDTFDFRRISGGSGE